MDYAKGTDLTELAQLVSDQAAALSRAKAEPKIVDLYGKKYLYTDDGCLSEIDKPLPDREFEYPVFTPYTLQGLVEWVKNDTDKLFTSDKPKALVVVESPTKVSVYSECIGGRHQRMCYASCSYTPPEIWLNSYRDSELMFVNIQTCFVQDAARDIVLKIVNNITEEQSAQTSDDGISQRVTVKSGVQEVDKTIFKNPAPLRPMRTFTEVEQPVSNFVVRFREGKQAALFEADGGKWKTVAVQTIGDFLRKALSGTNTVVIS